MLCFWVVCAPCALLYGVRGSLALVTDGAMLLVGVRALCVLRAVSMAPWRSFTNCAVLVGGERALCVLCAVSMAPWRLFTGRAVVVCVGCALRVARGGGGDPSVLEANYPPN